MLALLGLLAVAGYQNRDKISEALGGLQNRDPNSPEPQGGLGGIFNGLAACSAAQAPPAGWPAASAS